MRQVTLLIVLALLASCKRAAPPPPPPAVQSAADAEAPPPPPPDPELATWSRLHDWRSTIYGQRAPNPPSERNARPMREKGRFPFAAVKSVRVFLLGGSVEGETALPFGTDGSLDDRIILPVVTLTDEERDRVLGHVRKDEADPERHAYKCGFDPHHVLVYYDASDRPVARSLVCLGCGEIQSFPSTKQRFALEDEERADLVRILDAHGLAASLYMHSDEPSMARHDALWERWSADRARRAALPSTVDGAQTPRMAGEAEVKRFCHWLEEDMRDAARPSAALAGACANRKVSWKLAREGGSCTAESLCDVPLGRIETCLRRSFLAGAAATCDEGLAPECAGLMACLPYVRHVE